MTPPTGTPPFLLLGQVLRPHGIRGELRVEVLTAYPERIGPGQRVYLGPSPTDVSAARLYTIVQARQHQKYLILQLAGIGDRNAAELLREQYVMVAFEDAVPLEDGEYYLFQVIGLEVVTTEGEVLGSIQEVLETGANDVFVVRGPRGEVLLPVIDECVQHIDFDAGRITVRLLEDLLGE
ncbi:MAG: 16S rRNA processing protein RimM [Anaerolineae bacterium]|nr:16S rRNA processing protein RimM [Anaerolineae bacterium]